MGKGRSPPGRHLDDRLRKGRQEFWTRSADPGRTVHGEAVRRVGAEEWRRWDPRRSKVAAGLLRTEHDALRLLPAPDGDALYLGAGHGGTISHLHDLIAPSGRLVAVDIAPRCLRDLVALARRRPGIVPVLGDARKPDAWRMLLPRGASWLFQDVAQAHQASMFTAACTAFLRPGGVGLLSLKVASDRGMDPVALRRTVEAELQSAGLPVDEVMDLSGLEDDHLLFVVRRGGADA